jgi:serine/threonine protein phosphatase 1
MKSKGKSETASQFATIREISERPHRLFAVGDIHGHYTELSTILNHLISDHGACADDLFVFVGDYIDRGPGSRQVIDLMLELRAKWPKTVFLKGNHEDMLLSYLGFGGQSGQFYLPNGGTTFFQSYGVEPGGPISEMRVKLPAAHLDFLRGLELGVSLAEFLFVHAGIDPQKSLSEQSVEDLMWIRKEFIEPPHNAGKTVVFGHTAFNNVYLQLPYKIGIDTGVAYGNKLSIVELVHGNLFQIEVGGTQVQEGNLRDLLPKTP